MSKVFEVVTGPTHGLSITKVDHPFRHDRLAICSLWSWSCTPSTACVMANGCWVERSASVTGPMRTPAGFDLMFRNLLANPQIRAVAWGGRDLSPDSIVTRIFESLPDLSVVTPYLRPDLLAAQGLHGETLADILRSIAFPKMNHPDHPDHPPIPIQNEDRPSGRIVLPPPAAPISISAPPGDPGDRIAADLLREVWPSALERILTCGETVPTQYGPARELRDMITVIRDPTASSPSLPSWMGLSESAIQDYYDNRLVSPVKPDGVAYTYGTRLTRPVDQVGSARLLLIDSPDTRAAYLSPWQQEEDAGKESNRPCLVGVWFRRTGSFGTVRNVATGERGRALYFSPVTARVQLDNGLIVETGPSAWQKTTPWTTPELHMSVIFRSHDIFGAWPLNLAGACLWLQHEAECKGLAVGTLTCHSLSAHIYERDVSLALETLEKSKETPRSWASMKADRRTSWNVQRVNGHVVVRAMAAGTGMPLATFSAPTPELLRSQIERSGLIQSVGSALWLGERIHAFYKSNLHDVDVLDPT